MRSLSSEMTISSANVLREKCTRNKRKFLQDPPLITKESSDGKNCGGNTVLLCEGESWTPEPRSVEVLMSENLASSDSLNRKRNAGGTNSLSGQNETCRSFHQDQVKLMRFRSDQAKVVQVVGAGWEGKREESEDGHGKVSEKEDDFCELEEADWDDCTENELEELLLKNLGPLYNEAINKLVASGHNSEAALRAVLKHGRCDGGKDTVSNIVENTLAYLRGKKLHATDGRDHSFSDLNELHKHSIAEMVGLLREVRPLLSKGDAMWRLLICEMNVQLACVMDDPVLPLTDREPCPGSLAHLPERVSGGSSSSPTLTPVCNSNLTNCSTPTCSNARSLHSPTDAPASSLPLFVSPSLATTSSSALPLVSPPDVSLLTLLDSKPKSVSRDPSDETSSNFGESTSEEGSLKVELLAAVDESTSSEADDLYDDDEDEEVQELMNSAVMPAIASLKLVERVHQERETTKESEKKGNIFPSITSDPPLVTAQPSQVMDVSTEIKKVEDLEFSESKKRTVEPLRGDACELHLTTNDSISNSEKPWNSVSILANCDTNGTCQDELTGTLPKGTGSGTELRDAISSPAKSGIVKVGAEVTQIVSSRVPPSEAESTLSMDGTVITRETVQAFLQAAQKTDTECLSKETSTSEAPDHFNKETSVWRKGQVEDQKDEMIMKLVHRSKELETHLQERTEWAKQKVMQAARRLSSDLQELKGLRAEREEGARLKKDKEALEDSTAKKLTDLENALWKAKSQLDEANKSVKKLDTENAEVRAEMQAAKLSAAEAQSSCQDLAKRERKSMKRIQAWEKQRAKLQEDLSEEKRKIIALQQQVVVAKERQQQAEVRWRQEEKAKEEALLRADHERRTREQAEIAAKKREEAHRRKAESNYQRHREDIQRLENEIAHFRTSAEAAQLATSRWGPGVAVSQHMIERSTLQALKESNNRLAREIAELQDIARRDVRRERECVMCMCEEMAVVFLPCAHQVVCLKCNDLHEKQGMRDCPSCRTPIKQRIRVYGVST